MSHPFEYRKPTEEQANLMSDLSAQFAEAYDCLLEVAVASAERTLAIRKLQEARMWANVAILEIQA